MNDCEDNKNYINSGFEYENRVINCINSTILKGTKSISSNSNAHTCDANFLYKDKLYNLEIKLDRNAQMGGTSIKYQNNEFSFISPVNFNLQELLLPALKSKEQSFNDLISYIKNKNCYMTNDGLPFSCPKDVWNEVQSKNLLINVKIPYDAEFVNDHYSKKDVNYIQIGKSGLFYMKDNPADLPVPQLNGNINIEIRTGRSGSKFVKSINDKIVGVGIRIQGRLKTKNKSPYTLDCINNINELVKFTS